MTRYTYDDPSCEDLSPRDRRIARGCMALIVLITLVLIAIFCLGAYTALDYLRDWIHS